MTIFEIQQKIQKDQAARSKNAEAIIAFVRALVSTLKDLGREHAAKELEQLLFIYDAHIQEADAWYSQNSRRIADAILETLEKRPPT